MDKYNIKEKNNICKNMIFGAEARKRYSSGSLLRKVNCGGRKIKIEYLDVHTAERINRRVSATAKQHVVELHSGLQGDDIVFGGPVKRLKLKIK